MTKILKKLAICSRCHNECGYVPVDVDPTTIVCFWCDNPQMRRPTAKKTSQRPLKA